MTEPAVFASTLNGRRAACPTTPSSTKPVLDETVLMGTAERRTDHLFLVQISELFRKEVSRLSKEVVRQSLKRNACAVEIAAHTLYGAAAGVGALRLSARCLQLEDAARIFPTEDLRQIAIDVLEEAVMADLAIRGLTDRMK